MDFKDQIIIKEEPTEFGEEENQLLDYNVSVKIENCATPDEIWYAKNEAVFAEFQKQIHEAEKNNQCRICGQIFDERYLLLIHNMKHLRVMINNKIFQCHTCVKYFTNQHNLETHMSMHNKKKTKREMNHKCDTCGQVLPYKKWYYHKKYKHSNEPSECSQCLKKFKSLIYLRRHEKYIHDGIKAPWRNRTKIVMKQNLPCKECNKVFTNKDSLKDHMRNCHCQPHQCYICKSILKSKSYLLTHMRRIHNNCGKTHACEICGKKFKSARYVRIHIRNSHIKSKTIKKDEIDEEP